MKEAIIQYNDNPDVDGNRTLISWKELVRCKDCKHWDEKKNECHNIHSYMQYRQCFKNWFCADGERRTDDA